MCRFVVALWVLCSAAVAHARANDVNLTGLVLRSSRTTFNRNFHTPLFRQLATELGLAIAPVLSDPAETTGALGFDIGFSTAVTNINETADYWRFVRRGTETVDSALALTSMHVRKALPFSFELQGTAGWLAGSEMFAIGLQVKWSLNEGFYYIPDVAIRGSVNVGIGSRDMQIVTAGFDLSISKSFGLGGVASLTPFTGYNLLIINASSHVLDPTPEEASDIEKNFVFAPETLIAHRFFVGLRFKTYFVALTAAVELAFADNIPFSQSYVGRLSFDF